MYFVRISFHSKIALATIGFVTVLFVIEIMWKRINCHVPVKEMVIKAVEKVAEEVDNMVEVGAKEVWESK